MTLKFDLQKLERILTDAGVSPVQAKAHVQVVVTAIETALAGRSIEPDRSLPASRIELAIGNLSADLARRINNQTWICVGGVTLLACIFALSARLIAKAF